MARDHIRTLRTLKKLSQTALAKATGLTASEISRIECGYRDMTPAEASAIAQALGVSVQEVTGALPPPAEANGSRKAVPTSAAPTPAPAPAASNDLRDPANFREMPDLDLLEAGETDVEAFRARLREAVQRATEILHTSKVPASVWRAWRDFERRAQKALQTAASGGPAPSMTSEPQLDHRELLLLAERSFQARRTSKLKHREKSFNALLFEVVHQSLPIDRAEKLNEEAELRLQNDRSTGFMRHFRAAVQEQLSRAELEKLIHAVQTREANRKAGHRYTPAHRGVN